jgi:chaperone required for assembly of F1-ATPase
VRELFDEAAGQPAPDPARRMEAAPKRKRFYTTVTVAEGEGGWHVQLDGRPIRTPTRKIVAAPVRIIADGIAAEWQAQGEILQPMTMPLTRLANSTVEGVVGNEAAIADDIAKFFGTDLVCYRAGHPAALAAREAAAWDGVVFWMAETFGAHFILAEGIVPVTQPAPALAAARGALPDGAWALAALHVVTTLTGSALLALALWHGARTPDAVWSAAHVDEDWNVETWGVDDEVAARRAARWRDFEAASYVIAALRP